MPTNKELIQGFMERLKEDLTQDLHDKNISDGDLNMKPVADDEAGQLNGNDYYYYLVHGRKPGTQPPMDSILDWIKKKGITADISDKSLAFLIARKIGRMGSEIYLGKRPALDLPGIVEINEGIFNAELSNKYMEEITSAFTDGLKKVFA